MRHAKLPREGQLTDKDMSVLREGDSVNVQHKASRSLLKDYSLSHQVELEWDLNEDAQRERMFRLRVGDREVILDAEEVIRSLRWV